MSAVPLVHLAVLPPTDADLLARYVGGRDGMAFAELVRRHGPMFLAFCWRLTHHAHGSDDVGHAVFLVLARKADRLDPHDRVGAWLYGVAVRAARKARTRSGREMLVAAVLDVPERTAEPVDPDAVRAVVEEVGRLPDFLRAAVVLCELEGRPRAAAARELGVAEGTLSSRLAAARKRLAARLAARGYGPAVLAPAVVPPDLAARAAGGPHSAAVAALAQGVLRTMFLQKLRFVPLVVGAAAALAAGIFAAQPPVPPPQPPVVAVLPQDPPPAAPALKAVIGPNRLVVWRKRELVSLDPDGKNEAVTFPSEFGGKFNPYSFAVSPDGKQVACVLQHYTNRDSDTPPTSRLYICAVGTGVGAAAELGEDGNAVNSTWSGDGKQLAVCTYNQHENLNDLKTKTLIYTPATKTRISVSLPDNHILADWSRDGRHFLTTALVDPRPDYLTPEGEPLILELWLMNRDGTPGKRLPHPDGIASTAGRFSPDGQRVLTLEVKVPPAETPKEKADREDRGAARPLPPPALAVYDLATGKAMPVKDVPPSADIQGFCWAPDGKRIAYVWRERHPPGAAPMTETTTSLTVCDPDGANRRTILSETARGTRAVTLAGVDWR